MPVKSVLCVLLMLCCEKVQSQIPVEVFAGHERTTVDIMFFKWFRNKDDQQTRWLFFNRNRASVDYRMTATTYLPQFGFTEAVSYNHEKLGGFAPVLVGQVFGSGAYFKAGIQYALIRKTITFFSWIVCETNDTPDLDYFLLFRYTPRLTDKVNLFVQFESVNAFPTNADGISSFTQRFRLGLQRREWQFGAGADFNWLRSDHITRTSNIGGFIRHEF